MRSKRVRGSTTNVLCGGLADSDTFTAIDPGVSYFGWATFYSGKLGGAGLATTYMTGATALIERPVFRPGSLADPRDVVDLAFTAGLVAGHYGAVSWVEPNDWKGTVDGVVFLNRARRELKRKWSADAGVIEAALAKLPKKMHEHVLDAYALGMWGLGESLL
jgi:hypothetical protein